MAGFFESIAAKMGRRPMLAAWVTGGASAGARALYARDGERLAPLWRDAAFPADCDAAIMEGAFDRAGVVALNDARLFLEPVSRDRKLIICGAGHVSMPVIQLGVMLNFEVTAIDDRAEFAERAKAAGAHRAICRPFAEALDGIDGDPSTAFVIMTREHAYDVDCLRLILKKPGAYVGMMGSHSRTEHIRRQLLSEGFDAGAIARAHMPIGLPIGSRTPEEIAVSVMAEVIQVMNASDEGEGYPPGMLRELALLEGNAAPTAVLAMIVEKRGEAPRRPGAKMLVKSDGRFLGTVGGGSAEAMILEAARGMMREGRREPRTVAIALQKGTMHCGGEIEVFLLPV